MENRSAQAGIPAAWTYGIIRQESRFVTLAQSSANANGLMQLIPSTARIVARSLGLNNFTLDQLGDIDTNVQLGTAYLAQTKDKLDGSFPLASAGYNAGPGRPPQWKSTLTRTVDGAIYAETIPIAETRGYVKNVMANTVFYYLAMKQRPPKLKDLMGTVSPY
jgi:soluble lytic murein transglycosylase